ncbi:MAG: PAS domain S-box protein [Bacteroidales bacterium]|nr:PAS domain S-box protein [Bacteroidales bacterium]
MSNISLQENDKQLNIVLIGIDIRGRGLSLMDTALKHFMAGGKTSIFITHDSSSDFEQSIRPINRQNGNYPIQNVIEGMEIKPGFIYVVPNKKYIDFEHEKLKLIDYPFHNGKGSPFNLLIKPIGSSDDMKLLEFENKFQSFIQQSHEAMVIVNSDCEVQEWNNAHEKLTGFSRNEVLGKKIWEVQWNMIPPEHKKTLKKSEIQNVFEGYFENGKSEWIGKNIKASIFTKNGELRHINQTTFAITTGQGNMIGSITRDITEQLKAEKVLKENEEFLRIITGNLNDIVWRMELDGTFSFVSPSVTKILGYGPDEAIGLNVNQLIHPDDMGLVELIMEQGYKNTNKNAQIHEFKVLKSSGDVVIFEISINELRDNDNKLIAFTGVSRDISERKKMESKIQETEIRFKTVFNQAAIGISITDKDSKFVMINEKFCEITGYTNEELKNHTYEMITHPDDLKLDKDKVDQIVDNKIDSFILEKRYIHKNGSIVWINLHANVIRDTSGNVLYGIAAIVDITKSKKTSAELTDKEKQVHFLATAALELAEFEKEQDIWQYTADKIYEITNNEGVVIVSDYKNETNHWSIKAYCGLGRYVEKVNQLFGAPLIKFSGTRDFLNRNNIVINKITELSSNPDFYSVYGIPKLGLRAGFTLFKVDKIYEIIFAQDSEILGFVNLVKLQGNKPFKLELVEAFVSQVSIFLRRKIAEKELENYKGKLEDLVKERTMELEEKNQELERFNQLFIGREFRIKELKEKIAKLEKPKGESE